MLPTFTAFSVTKTQCNTRVGWRAFAIVGATSPAMSVSHHVGRHRPGGATKSERRKTGYGPWVVVEKAGRTLIGTGGLYEDPFDVGWGIEFGYHFAKTAWGNGYATELTEFCLQMAHARGGFTEVRAFAHPNNAASQSVLEKTGFARQRFLPIMNRYLFAHRHDQAR